MSTSALDQVEATGTRRDDEPMTHKEIMEVLVGLLSALFVALISTTIVSTALPRIIGSLNGTQTQYTWVVTASLLAMTVTGPIWSKLADLFSKKLLVQLSIGVFLIGSLVSGAVQNVPELLAGRALQGIGMGGLIALAQAIIGSIIPPRERGRYSGYMAATMAVATVSGPLLGGLIVDAFGWRWCFWVAIPFALAGLMMLQKYLHLQTIRREVRIDYWGTLFITLAASLPLVWVSFAGTQFDWLSTPTALFWAGAFVALALAVVVERRHPDPVVPPRILKQRITVLAVVGSLAVGIAQFGGSVFLSQYFQVARSHTATQAGLLMIPLILGSVIGSAGGGQYVSRTGRWKGLMLLSSALLILGLVLLGLIDHTTPIWHLSVFMALMGLGTGGLMQNLVLVVQNTVDVTEIGAASGVVSFFRSLGGAMGVAVLGAVLSTRVSSHVVSGLQSAGLPAPAGGSSQNLDFANMPAQVAQIVHTAYADATGRVFLIAGVIAIITLVAVALMPVTELRTTIRKDDDEPGQAPEPIETRVPEQVGELKAEPAVI